MISLLLQENNSGCYNERNENREAERRLESIAVVQLKDDGTCTGLVTWFKCRRGQIPD